MLLFPTICSYRINFFFSMSYPINLFNFYGLLPVFFVILYFPICFFFLPPALSYALTDWTAFGGNAKHALISYHLLTSYKLPHLLCSTFSYSMLFLLLISFWRKYKTCPLSYHMLIPDKLLNSLCSYYL